MFLSWGLFSPCKDKGQKPQETNKQPFKVFNDTPIKTLNIFTLFKTVAQPTVFSKCHPKSSSSSLKLISNEMVLAVSIANQIVVFTSQILRDMAITLTPNSHTHPKPKQFFSFSESKQRFHQFSVSFCWTCMAYFEFFKVHNKHLIVCTVCINFGILTHTQNQNIFFSFSDLSKQRFPSTKMLFPFVEPTGSSLLKIGWPIFEI